MRSERRQVALLSTAAFLAGRWRRGRRGAAGGGGERGLHQAVAPYLRIDRRAIQPASENIAAEKSSTAAIANSVALEGFEPRQSMFLTIVGASGREGS